MKDIYIYATLDSWLREEPDASLRGDVLRRTEFIMEIRDEQGYTQYINLQKLFAVVF